MDKLLAAMAGAAGDPGAQAVIAADFVVDSFPEELRDDLRRGLDVAATLHWFDSELLSSVMGLEEEASWYRSLIDFPFVEAWEENGNEKRKGEGRFSVHESTRLAWRARLHGEANEDFRALSQKCADHFKTIDSSRGRIEWIYHLLSGNPEDGARQLEEMGRGWSQVVTPEVRADLCVALDELDETGLVFGLAGIEVKLAILEWKSSLGQEASLEAEAISLLDLAEAEKDSSALARTHLLVGDVFVSKGNQNRASRSFREAFQILEQLTNSDPGNAGWKRDLAVSYSRVGDLAQEQGNLEEAATAYGECLRLSRELVGQDPGNAGWKRDLAVSYSRVGDLAQVQGNLEEAGTAYGECLRLNQELVGQDPGNAGWKRELAVSYSKMGDLAQEQGNLEEAGTAYGEYLRLNQELVGQDPGNAGWKRELAVSYSKVGDVAWAQGNLEEAATAYGECLRLSRELVGQDPGNAGWKRDLAVSYSRVGDVAQVEGNLEEAGTAYGEYLRLSQELVGQDPGNAGWKRELAVSYSKMGDVAQAQGTLEEAGTAYGECLRLNQELVAQDPGNAQWAVGLAYTEVNYGFLLIRRDDQKRGRGILSSGIQRLQALKEQGKLDAMGLKGLADLEGKAGP